MTASPNYLSLTAPYGTIELSNPRFVHATFAGSVALTAGAGGHPLSDGIRQLTIVGIEGTPRIGREGETITLDAPGIRLTLHGAEARVDNDLIRISVKRPADVALARR